jgi:hypothetical protein
MRRYLTRSECEAALNRGRQIEQFLGGYLEGCDPAIRYAVVRRENERLVATVYEHYEPSDANFFDVGEFRSVQPDSDPEDHYFDSLDEAISFLTYDRGASPDKFVNQGMVDEEYKDYAKAKNS